MKIDTYDPSGFYNYLFVYDREVTNRILVYVKSTTAIYECVGSFSEPTYRSASMSYYNQDFVMISSVNRGINTQEVNGNYQAVCNNVVSDFTVSKGVSLGNNLEGCYQLSDNRYKMAGGIGTADSPKLFWVDSSSIQSSIHQKIVAAWGDWMDASDWDLTSPVHVTESTDYTYSCFDFHMADLKKHGDDTIGTTYLYDGLTEVSDRENNTVTNHWTWAKIMLDDNLLTQHFENSYGDLDFEKQTIAHEIGHSLGLFHTASAGNNVMYQARDSFLKVDKPMLGEFRGLYDLYC